MQEIAGKNEDDVETQTATSFSKELRQSVENLQLQGMSEKWGKQLKHPISGQKIYVSIVGISHKSVAKARLMEVSQAKATRAVIKSNQKSKGVKAGIEKAITEQKNDKSSFNEGVKRVILMLNQILVLIAQLQRHHKPVQETQHLGKLKKVGFLEVV